MTRSGKPMDIYQYQKQIGNSFCFYWENLMHNARMRRIFTFKVMEIVGLGGETFELILGPNENNFIECEIVGSQLSI